MLAPRQWRAEMADLTFRVPGGRESIARSGTCQGVVLRYMSLHRPPFAARMLAARMLSVGEKTGYDHRVVVRFLFVVVLQEAQRRQVVERLVGLDEVVDRLNACAARRAARRSIRQGR